MKYTLKSGEQFIVDGYTSEGEHKVLNLLDTNTDDIATLKVVSHTKLQYLKNTQQLSPGTFYRIIDYKCTTTQENTRVGQGQFDIVVQAISESELSEKGHCIRHSGDSYFSDCRVESWEVNYSLDNDKSRYSWADDEVIAICNDDDPENIWHKRRPELDEISGGTQYYAWDKIWNNENDDYWMLRDVDKDDTPNIDNENNYQGDCIYTTVNNPKQGQSIQKYYKSGSNFFTNGINSYHVIQKGHGVIYWMKDEFGNECPYDFKHLRFLDSTNNNYAWTFNKPLVSLPTKTIINAKIWVDSFWDDDDGVFANDEYTEEEIDADYTLNRKGKVYDYTGNSIEYDGKTVYVWRYSRESEDNDNSLGINGIHRKSYVLTTELDYSDVSLSDHIVIYAFAEDEEANSIAYGTGKDFYEGGEAIYHGEYSEEIVPDLSAIVDDLSSVEATMIIDNFVDRNGNWGVASDYDINGPEDLPGVPENYWDEFGDYRFTGNCVQYDGKILFLWYNDNIDSTLFTTGLDYSGYTAVDQVCPVYALGNSEAAPVYDQKNDEGKSKNLRSIVVSATYAGPLIPGGNLIQDDDNEEDKVEQNLTSSIEYNIIPIKYDELGAQILDLTQIYYGPKKGYPYTKEEIDEAHKVIASALNEQKEKKAEKIELVPIEGAIIEQEIEPGKYYQFGTVSSLSITLAGGEAGVLPKYQFIFTAASNSTQLDFPETCRIGDNYSIQMTAGKTYEITIQGGIIRAESATFSS